MVQAPGERSEGFAHGDEIEGHPLLVEAIRGEAHHDPPAVAVHRLGAATPGMEAVSGLESTGDLEDPSGHGGIVT